MCGYNSAQVKLKLTSTSYHMNHMPRLTSLLFYIEKTTHSKTCQLNTKCYNCFIWSYSNSQYATSSLQCRPLAYRDKMLSKLVFHWRVEWRRCDRRVLSWSDDRCRPASPLDRLFPLQFESTYHFYRERQNSHFRPRLPCTFSNGLEHKKYSFLPQFFIIVDVFTQKGND